MKESRVFFYQVKTFFRFSGAFFWFLCVFSFMLLLAPFFWKNPKLNKWCFRWFAWGGKKILGIKVCFQGEEILKNLPDRAVLIGNHQSVLDFIVFGQYVPDRLVIIGKKEVRWIPFFGWFFYAAGNIFVDRKRTQSAKEKIQFLAKVFQKKRFRVAMMPEGTRNRAQKGLLPFKKGAFHLAIAAQVPIVALVCSSFEKMWDPKRFLFFPSQVEIKVLPVFETKNLKKEDASFLCEKVRKAMRLALDGVKTNIFSSRINGFKN